MQVILCYDGLRFVYHFGTTIPFIASKYLKICQISRHALILFIAILRRRIFATIVPAHSSLRLHFTAWYSADVIAPHSASLIYVASSPQRYRVSLISYYAGQHYFAYIDWNETKYMVLSAHRQLHAHIFMLNAFNKSACIFELSHIDEKQPLDVTFLEMPLPMGSSEDDDMKCTKTVWLRGQGAFFLSLSRDGLRKILRRCTTTRRWCRTKTLSPGHYIEAAALATLGPPAMGRGMRALAHECFIWVSLRISMLYSRAVALRARHHAVIPTAGDGERTSTKEYSRESSNDIDWAVSRYGQCTSAASCIDSEDSIYFTTPPFPRDFGVTSFPSINRSTSLHSTKFRDD